MGDRDQPTLQRNRNPKVERACSNAPPHNSIASRNHAQAHTASRHDAPGDLRNRHRERAQNRSANEPSSAPSPASSQTGPAFSQTGPTPSQTSPISSQTGPASLQTGPTSSQTSPVPAVDSTDEASALQALQAQKDEDCEAVEDNDSTETDSTTVSSCAEMLQTARCLADPARCVLVDPKRCLADPARLLRQHNWQAGKATLKERISHMFNNELLADIHFLVGRSGATTRVAAHKFVLSVSSAVFDAMFNRHGGVESVVEEIELPDVEPAAFLSMLWFFYSDEVRLGPDTVMTLLYTAKKYAVPALEQACVEFLKRNLSSENAFMLLAQARLFDEPQLAALCLDVIDRATSEALVADGFTDIDLDTLCVLLERDTLGVRECKLFTAVCRWAEAECARQGVTATRETQRGVLGRALALVRFPLMTVEEFAAGAAQSGLLTDREVVQLFLYHTVQPRPGVAFCDTPRCCLTGKEQVVTRFCQIENRWGYSGTSDRIRFSVNRKIFVVGFGLYGSIHVAAEYLVNIQIVHTDSGQTCGAHDTSFLSDGSMATFRVLFLEPVEILVNTSYTACATLKGPDSYYGTKGLRKVSHESALSGKITVQFTYAAGNNNGTSVEDGQLPEIIFYT